MKHRASTVTKSELNRLLNKYKRRAIIKGSELCLRPNDALRLVDELENLGVTILGVDGWYYATPEHKKKAWLSSDLNTDLYIGDQTLQGADPVHDSARVVRQFLLNDLPEQTEFVSLTLDVPSDWDSFLVPSTH
jgi:hypothetical protein